MEARAKVFVVIVVILAVVWIVGVVVLIGNWLDSAVLFTTPHPDEARRNAADTLRLAAGVVAGPVVIAVVAKVGSLGRVALIAGVIGVVLAGLFAVPVYHAIQLRR